MFLLYYFGLIKNLEGLLNYSEASILIIITFNFIIFGSISDLKNYINLIKIKTENWVYRKYVKLDEKIKINKKELKALEKEI